MTQHARFSRIVTAIAAVTLAVSPQIAGGQLPIPSIHIMGGVSHYHLATNGTTPIGAVRIELPVVFAVAEGSVGIFRPDEGPSGTHTYVIPEVQLQWQLFPTIVRPYVGVGGGWFRAISGAEPHNNDFTISGSAGIRAGLPLIPLGFRAEARVRAISGSLASQRAALELMAGVSW